MKREEIRERVQNIFRDIFNNVDLQINDNTNADDIDEWDSLNHINLINAIEEKFAIRFALGELQEMKNVGEMLNLIEEKLDN
jgi:acyl carrier protein